MTLDGFAKAAGQPAIHAAAQAMLVLMTASLRDSSLLFLSVWVLAREALHDDSANLHSHSQIAGQAAAHCTRTTCHWPLS